MINCEFKIDASKLSLLERLKNIIDKNYKDPVKSSVEPINLDIVNTSADQENSDSDDELEIVFTNDEAENQNQKWHSFRTCKWG